MNNKIVMGLVVGAILLIGGLMFFGSQNSNNQSNSQERVSAPTTNPTIVEETMEEEEMEEVQEQTIVEIAASNEDFSTLVTAVTQAELVDTLNGEGPFTVFAPTNAAFEALGQETIEAVLADQEQLTSILTYHVVPGKVMAEEVVTIPSATSVNGAEVTFTVNDDGTVSVNNATIVATDIEASNGVIHVIDTVLIPE